jgi:ABC transport system ATP-binding/permease protein
VRGDDTAAPSAEPTLWPEQIPLAREPSGVRPLPGRALRIGRAPDNDIVVSDSGISRYHAELRNVAGAYSVVDLDSSNGTFVNGRRTARRRRP